MINYIYIALILFALTACTGETGSEIDENRISGDDHIVVTATEPEYQIVLEHQVTINQLNEPHIQNFWTLYTDDDGNIYWQDNRIAKLHQYSPEGEYVRSFGEKGKGPGEFEYLESSSISGDAIIMLDWFSQLVHIFNRHSGKLLKSGTLERINTRDLYSLIHRILADTDSTFIGIPEYNSWSSKDSLSLQRYTTSGKLLADRLITVPFGDALESRSGGVSRRTPASFNAKSEVALLPDGGFVHSYAADPVFNVYDSAGNRTQSIIIDFQPVELTRAHIDTLIKKSHPMIDLGTAVIDADQIPDRWPVWSQYFVSGDGNLWVEMFTNPPQVTEWWVISQEGVLLAKESFSDFGYVRYAAAENIYLTTFEDQIHKIHRYSLEMREMGRTD